MGIALDCGIDVKIQFVKIVKPAAPAARQPPPRHFGLSRMAKSAMKITLPIPLHRLKVNP
jgi:hypothetical protein